jgi:oligopeptidase B
MKNIMVIIIVVLFGCNVKEENKMEAPKAKKIAKELTEHGDVRIDDYFWMRLSDEQKNAETPDEQTKDVLAYLNEENKYATEMMKHTEALQKELYDEIVGRIKQDDESVPVRNDGYIYYDRFEKGQDYGLNCRKKDEENAPEEILLNQPELAKGHAYFSVAGRSISTNNNLLVYGVDLVSRREYTLYVKDLSTGKLLADKIENTTGGATWANDNKTFFYTKKDPVTLRSYQIYKHTLGTPQEQDVLVYEEKDETFYCFVYKSKSKKFIFIGSGQTLSSEYRYLNADEPNGEFKIFNPREENHRYGVDHFEESFYVRTNDKATNFKLMKTPIEATTKENWKEVIAHREDVLLEGMEIFKDYLVVSEREKGLETIRVIKWENFEEHYIEFKDPAYTVYLGANPSFDTPLLRFSYSSLTTPYTEYDYDMATKGKTMLKQQEVMDSTFSPDNYVSERVFVEVRDGVKVPVSLVYKKGVKKDGTAPLLLYGYGSYGASMDAGFSSVRLSLLDRGFIYAIAHVRGGQEMGRQWMVNYLRS